MPARKWGIATSRHFDGLEVLGRVFQVAARRDAGVESCAPCSRLRLVSYRAASSTRRREPTGSVPRPLGSGQDEVSNHSIAVDDGPCMAGSRPIVPLATLMGPPIATIMGPGDGPTTEAIFATMSRSSRGPRRPPKGPEALGLG